MTIQSKATLLALTLTAGLLTACQTTTAARVQTAVAQTSMASAGNGTHNITDMDSGAVAHTIDDGEIQLAQLALTNASSQQVKDFAKMMISDHQNGNQMLETNGYRAASNLITDVLNSDVKARMTKLSGLSGAAFDREYMKGQVELHETALETFRTTLVPSAQDLKLRQTLATMQQQVETHLQHARTLQSTVGNM
jgi:putative membrane protein